MSWVLLVLFLAGTSQTFAQESRRVIIDTDTAMGYLFRDIDDGLMLVAALTSPELEIVGITTTAGNVEVRKATERAREIARIVGRDDIPIVPGLAPDAPPGTVNEAARFIRDSVLEYPGEITILTAGPITNLAAALVTDPRTAGAIREVIAVGGLIESSESDQLHLPYDLNFGRDPDAVRTVLASEVELTLIHIELCLEFMLERGEFGAMLDKTGDLGEYLRPRTRSWRLIKGGNIVLWDVVALNYLLHPDWYETMRTGVSMTEVPGARPTVTLRSGSEYDRVVRIPMRMAEPDDYWRWLEARLIVAGRHYIGMR